MRNSEQGLSNHILYLNLGYWCLRPLDCCQIQNFHCFDQNLSKMCKNVKNLRKDIFTSIWSAQHPIAGQNLQHPYEIVNKWSTSICYLYCKIRNLISKSYWCNFTVTTLKIYQSQTLKNCKTFLSILGRVSGQNYF